MNLYTNILFVSTLFNFSFQTSMFNVNGNNIMQNTPEVKQNTTKPEKYLTNYALTETTNEEFDTEQIKSKVFDKERMTMSEFYREIKQIRNIQINLNFLTCKRFLFENIGEFEGFTFKIQQIQREDLKFYKETLETIKESSHFNNTVKNYIEKKLNIRNNKTIEIPKEEKLFGGILEKLKQAKSVKKFLEVIDSLYKEINNKLNFVKYKEIKKCLIDNVEALGDDLFFYKYAEAGFVELCELFSEFGLVGLQNKFPHLDDAFLDVFLNNQQKIDEKTKWEIKMIFVLFDCPEEIFVDYFRFDVFGYFREIKKIESREVFLFQFKKKVLETAFNIQSIKPVKLAEGQKKKNSIIRHKVIIVIVFVMLLILFLLVGRVGYWHVYSLRPRFKKLKIA